MSLAMSWLSGITSMFGPKVKREVTISDIGPFEQKIIPESFVRSRDLLSIGCAVLNAKGEMAVSINGKRGAFHEGVIAGYPVFNLSGAHFAYSAVDGREYGVSLDWNYFGPYKGLLKKTPLICPDGDKILYVIRDGGSETLMINGNPAFQIDAGWSTVEGSPCFSDDGGRTALIVEQNNSMRAVIDGRPEKIYEYVESYGFYAPDGSSYAYLAKKDGVNIVVRDGRELPQRSCAKPVFAGKYGDLYDAPYGAPKCPETKKPSPLAFFVKTIGEHFVVVDGREGKKYHCIATYTPIFSPDAKTVAYAVEDAGGKCFLVVNDDEYDCFDDIYSPTIKFSPDCNNILFRAMSNGKETVSLNGRPGILHEKIIDDPIFSPDGKHYAYTASDEFCVFAVIDGVKCRSLPGVGKPVFSPDGKRAAYVASDGYRNFVVEGESESEIFELVYNQPVFSPDGKHLIYSVNDGTSDRIVIDGEPGKPYKRIVNSGGSIRFSSNDTFHYMALENDRIKIIEEKIS